MNYERIEDDGYLMVVLRYIHQNPRKAGMVEDMGAYTWSSYNEYIKQAGIVTDIGFILNIFDPDSKKAAVRFKEFMEQENTDRCLDDEVRKRKLISDEEARALIKKLTGSANPQVLQTIKDSPASPVAGRMGRRAKRINFVISFLRCLFILLRAFL